MKNLSWIILWIIIIYMGGYIAALDNFPQDYKYIFGFFMGNVSLILYQLYKKL